MGNFFLPIVFENIFPPLSMMTFYLLAWISSLLVFYPKIFISKSLAYIYVFAILYFSLFYSGIFDVDLSWIRRELQSLFFAIIILQYFLHSRDFKGLKIILIISFVFIITTIITTLIGLQEFPDASRGLAGGLAAREEYELIDFYRSIGIAGYDFFYGLAFAIPVLVAYFKMNTLNVLNKYFFAILISLSIYGILRAQFTTAFIFALIGIILAFWTKEKVKPAVLRLILFLLLIMIIPEELIADGILSLSKVIEEGTLQNRLVDLSISVREGIGEQGTHIDRRYDRIPVLLDNFLSSPIIGGGESLGHNWWFDRLSMFGLIGIIPWILIIWKQIDFNLKILKEDSAIYYLITMFLFIGMGFIKNMGQTRVMIFMFFIIPSLLIIKDHMKHISFKHSFKYAK